MTPIFEQLAYKAAAGLAYATLATPVLLLIWYFTGPRLDSGLSDKENKRRHRRVFLATSAFLGAAFIAYTVISDRNEKKREAEFWKKAMSERPLR
jgi:hypothetical protein